MVLAKLVVVDVDVILDRCQNITMAWDGEEKIWNGE